MKATGTKLEVELDYQAMRLAGENNGELPPPDMEKNEFSSLLLLDLGAPKMLVSTPNSVLMLRIDFESRK